MSISRQPVSRVRSYSITHPPGEVMLPTRPGWDQLVFAHRGVFTARSARRAWTIPAHRAICVPDGTTLRIATPTRTAMRCLYLDRRLLVVGGALRVISVEPLTHELLAHAVASAPMTLDRPVDEALILLLADRVAAATAQPLHLPYPTDEMALQVAEAIAADPLTPIDPLVAQVGAGRRTIERRFAIETGMSLGRWRRRSRILAAVALLGEGLTVTEVAARVGYATPSSFVAAFRSELDRTPSAYLAGPTRRGDG